VILRMQRIEVIECEVAEVGVVWSCRYYILIHDDMS